MAHSESVKLASVRFPLSLLVQRKNRKLHTRRRVRRQPERRKKNLMISLILRERKTSLLELGQRSNQQNGSLLFTSEGTERIKVS
jgi:hypothetical protein